MNNVSILCLIKIYIDRSNLFVHSVLIYVFFIELSLPIDILSCGFLCCDVMLSFQEKGRRFGTIKTFNPSANICTCPKSGI